MKSRLLFLDHVGALGGAELTLIDVARHYRDSSLFLLFDDGPFRERLAQAGVSVQVLQGGSSLQAVRRETGWPGLNAMTQALGLARQVARRAREFDVLYANSQKAFVVACLAAKLARRPVIWDLNDLLLPEHFSRINLGLDVFLANHVAVRVIANSQASADAFVAQGGRSDKVRVVYNGLDPSPFDAVTDQDVARARAELGLNGAPLLGLFGRLTEWKGQHIALEAMTGLPDAHLLLVGDALFGEQRYAERLRERARELGISERVHFLGFRADIPRLMRLVRVILHTSTSPEPFGRVIVEAMLARKPVVASRAGGVSEIVTDGKTGFLVPPGDPSELAAAVHRVLADPGQAEKVAEAGRADAEARFTVSAMVEGITRNIEEAVRQ